MRTEAWVHFRAYNGSGYTVMEQTDLDDAREAVADFLLKARRNGHEITTLNRSYLWEIQTQSNIEGIAVTDEDGYLNLIEIEVIADSRECECDACTYEEPW